MPYHLKNISSPMIIFSHMYLVLSLLCSGAYSGRTDDYTHGGGRPRSRDPYDDRSRYHSGVDRRGYTAGAPVAAGGSSYLGGGSRPSSRSSRPSSRLGSAAPGECITTLLVYFCTILVYSTVLCYSSTILYYTSRLPLMCCSHYTPWVYTVTIIEWFWLEQQSQYSFGSLKCL